MNTRRILWWLLSGTRGGANRARILRALHEMPSNAHQLSETLNLDYKTIRHHLDVLLENGLIVAQGEGYGTTYFLSTSLEENYHEFEEIWVQIGKRRISKLKENEDRHDE